MHPLQCLQACSLLEEGRQAGWGQKHRPESNQKVFGEELVRYQSCRTEVKGGAGLEGWIFLI